MTKKKITIRLADRYDLNSVVKMWVELMELTAEFNPRYRLRSGAEEAQRALFADMLARDDSFLMVADVDGKLIAFANGYLTQPYKTFAQAPIGVIENLYVRESFRRRGLGREVSTRAAAWLTHFGATEVHVNVVPKNIDSLKFWRALGYEVHRVAMVKKP
ncbi:MAG TPA: GNAT family N-acetyltransferase [bacterium]|nr:GNAT family N-acetyltransferase [bacterium]